MASLNLVLMKIEFDEPILCNSSVACIHYQGHLGKPECLRMQLYTDSGPDMLLSLLQKVIGFRLVDTLQYFYFSMRLVEIIFHDDVEIVGRRHLELTWISPIGILAERIYAVVLHEQPLKEMLNFLLEGIVFELKMFLPNWRVRRI